MDQSIYIAKRDTPIILIVHVDDILVISPSNQRIQEIYTLLNNRVILKNLGEAETFLGIEIQRNRKQKTITLHQARYTKKILQKYRPNLKETSTPAIPVIIGIKLDPYEEK